MLLPGRPEPKTKFGATKGADPASPAAKCALAPSLVFPAPARGSGCQTFIFDKRYVIQWPRRDFRGVSRRCRTRTSPYEGRRAAVVPACSWAQTNTALIVCVVLTGFIGITVEPVR
jgi:hypothetical protein